MKKTLYRFIGGPLHNQKLQVEDDRSIVNIHKMEPIKIASSNIDILEDTISTREYRYDKRAFTNGKMIIPFFVLSSFDPLKSKIIKKELKKYESPKSY